ncbi:MAG: ABC transporter permease [Bryobacteraceae bacterium]|nr:ABC transporter permease [Bryobacteraceae bacterium]MDW8377617.1 ABC transporter permease [Bryobacterales bacterium]
MAAQGSIRQHWDGDFLFALRTLLLKDFRVRYRNMSLGVGWSLANPIIMMSVLTFVFTQIFPNEEKNYPIFVLCGLIPFNFFTLAWSTATRSLVDNASLIKRTRFPREIVPISTVLGNTVHLLIQIALLLTLVLVFGSGVSLLWLWLPVILALEVAFVIGMGLIFSAIDVYVRDIRYVVESVNLVLLWLVPIFYGFNKIPEKYHLLYRFNPVAAVVMALRNVLIEGKAPATSLIFNLTLVSTVVLAAGILLFGRLKRRFYDYL